MTEPAADNVDSFYAERIAEIDALPWWRRMLAAKRRAWLVEQRERVREWLEPEPPSADLVIGQAAGPIERGAMCVIGADGKVRPLAKPEGRR